MDIVRLCFLFIGKEKMEGNGCIHPGTMYYISMYVFSGECLCSIYVTGDGIVAGSLRLV